MFAELKPAELILVAAGVLRDASGRVLIAQRPAGGHVGGFWEFPGGKIQAGEDARRRPWLASWPRNWASRSRRRCRCMTLPAPYPERIVELHVF